MLDRNRPAQMRALSAKSKNPAINCGVFILNLAERVGFEPTVDSRPRLISSQVHSTTLPPLRVENQYFRKIAILTEV